MNANELADLLETGGEKSLDEVATMLRKQQEEIEYWKEMFEKAMKEQEK